MAGKAEQSFGESRRRGGWWARYGIRKQSLLFVFLVCVLFVNLLTNCFGAEDANSFTRFNRDNEGFILGRIVKSRQDGIFSAGGLPGYARVTNEPGEILYPEQYPAFFSYLSIQRYQPYMSQIGGQGIFFSILDRLLPLAPAAKMVVFYTIAALLSACALSILVMWLYGEFGLVAAGAVLLSLVFSKWLVLFGRSIFWSFWSFYVPMIAMILYLRKKKNPRSGYAGLGLAAFAGLLIKLIFSGYEYITTTLVMQAIPLLYYCLLDKVDGKVFARRLLALGVGAGLALVTASLILSVQIASVTGGPFDGVKHIVYSFFKRSYAAPGSFPEFYADSLKALPLPVFRGYLEGFYYRQVSYLAVILLFLVASLGLFWLRWQQAALGRHQNLWWRWREQLAAQAAPGQEKDAGGKDMILLLVTWCAILAPLSWFFIFKAHSYVHYHLNFIVWQMPFTLFGFAVVGRAAQGWAAEAWSRWGRKK